MHLAILFAGLLLGGFVCFCLGCVAGWSSRDRIAKIEHDELREQYAQYYSKSPSIEE